MPYENLYTFSISMLKTSVNTMENCYIFWGKTVTDVKNLIKYDKQVFYNHIKWLDYITISLYFLSLISFFYFLFLIFFLYFIIFYFIYFFYISYIFYNFYLFYIFYISYYFYKNLLTKYIILLYLYLARSFYNY